MADLPNLMTRALNTDFLQNRLADLPDEALFDAYPKQSLGTISATLHPAGHYIGAHPGVFGHQGNPGN